MMRMMLYEAAQIMLVRSAKCVSETCCLPRSKQRRHPGIGFIAVGMVIANHPPHRSEHALLTHSAPTSSM